MKRVWRFIKWSVKSFGWFEAYMCSICFFTAGAGTAGLLGDNRLRNLFFMLAVGVVVVAIVILFCRGIARAWQQFVKDDEQVFEILKQDQIK